MKKIVNSMLRLVAFINALRINKNEFTDASGKCLQMLEIPQVNYVQFINFDLPDNPLAHEYVHCIVKELDLWNEMFGFNEMVFGRLLKNQPYCDDFLKVVKNCNRNSKLYQPPARAFHCYHYIMKSDIAMKLKKDQCKASLDD